MEKKTLPENFCIKCEEYKSDLWISYIKFLNSFHDSAYPRFYGQELNLYYGIFGFSSQRKGLFADESTRGCEVLTLSEWDAIVNGEEEIPNFEVSSESINAEIKHGPIYGKIKGYCHIWDGSEWVPIRNDNTIEISRADVEKLKAEVFAKLKSAEASKEYEETLIQKIQDAAKNRTNLYNDYFEAQNKFNNAIQLLKSNTIHYIDKQFLS